MLGSDSLNNVDRFEILIIPIFCTIELDTDDLNEIGTVGQGETHLSLAPVWIEPRPRLNNSIFLNGPGEEPAAH
jgi:hypothetical protein